MRHAHILSTGSYVPERVVTNYERYRNSSAVTDFKEFPGRTHWIIAQDGWAEVAEHIATWLARQSRDSA